MYKVNVLMPTVVDASDNNHNKPQLVIDGLTAFWRASSDGSNWVSDPNLANIEILRCPIETLNAIEADPNYQILSSQEITDEPTI